MKKIRCIIIILLFFQVQAFASSYDAKRFRDANMKQIKLCINERNWYPFTYHEDSVSKGMHVDIVKKAVTSLNYSVKIDSLHRNRCIFSTQNGEYDAIISIAYNPSLGSTLIYPPKAEQVTESQWRIMQVDHMVITHTRNPYKFRGDMASIPAPVRFPFSTSLSEKLTNAGLLDIEQTNSDEQNFGMLLRDKTGSVITTSVIAESMNDHPKFKDTYKIQPNPLISQSFYLAFSPKTKISEWEKMEIWKRIATIRNDYVVMLQLFAQYE